jgi:hypothetical protein
MLYEDPKECLTDGSAEDCIEQALHEARAEAQRLKNRLSELCWEHAA